MRRQLLDPVGDESAVGVVRRLCAVQAQVASFAELCVRVRRTKSKPGDVGRALNDGRLVKTWAMRGTLHLLTPEDAGAFLSLIASGRSWERPSWQKYFGVTPKQLDALREVIREILAGKVLTREELIGAVTARSGYGHLGEALRSGWGTLLKPYAWQGDLCFGPNRGNRVTFVRPEDASSRWVRPREPEEAAAIAIVAYLRAYGPATVDNFHNWLSRGRVSTRQVRKWFASVGDRLREVEVGGERRYVLADDLDELLSTKPTKADILAQANLDGGGNTDEKRRAKTPLPVMPKEQPTKNVAVAAQTPETKREQRPELITQLNSEAAVQPQPAPEETP